MEADRATLLDVVKRAARIADRRPVMPILGNLRLAAEGGELAIEATRLSVSGRFTLPCQGDLAPALVSADRLVAILAGAGGERVVIEPLRKGWATIKAGTAAYRVASIDARDWPAQAGGAGAPAHPAGGAADAIRRVLPCASAESLAAAIRSVAAAGSEGMWLEVEPGAPGGVCLRASEPDVADAEDVVAGAEVMEGAAKAGFSFRVLSAAVAVGAGVPGAVDVQLGSSELDAARLDFGEAGFAVAMPMRL